MLSFLARILGRTSLAALAVHVALLACHPARPAAAAAPAAAPAAADAEVDRHTTLGQRHFERGRYQDAIAELRRAYELRADPELLRAIADSYRQLGIVDRALFFYDRYLAARPDAPDRDAVDDKIAELEQARATAAAALRPTFGRDVLIAPADEAPQEAPRAEASRRPPWRRWWFWTAVGAAVVVGAAAAVTVAAGRGESAPPASDLGAKRFY